MQMPEYNRKRRIVVAFAIVCALMSALLVRTFYLQLIKGQWLVEKALNQWTREESVSAHRGTIYDNKGEVLAQSGSADSVLLHPKTINASKDAAVNDQNANAVATALANILGMDAAEILAKAKDTTKYEIWLKRQISKEQSAAITAATLKGVSLAVDTKRYYPKGDFMTQVLGFTSIDGAGLEGMEAYLNKYLTGTAGSITSQTDVRGNEIAFAEQFYTPATNGYDVYLTLDYVIQSVAEAAAQDALDRYKAKGVMCIVMDPQTGAILAVTNRPGYDLNNVPRDNMDLLTAMTRNGVFANASDPGSVFKVFTLAAALDTGVANESNHFNCNGGRQMPGSFVKCDTNHGDNISLATGLARSCNSVFMDLAFRLHTDRLYDYINRFGFGQKTGVDFPSESSGLMIKQEKVKDDDLARIGFGQSITTTPLQTITAFCSVINGGTLLEPHLVQKVLDANGGIVEQHARKEVRQVIDTATSERMRALLKYVVDDGSGSRAQLSGYTVGGKTGTAQKYDENGKIKTTHLSSFIGFAPVENPQVAVLFMVDEAEMENDHGSVVAAPYAGQILEESLKHLGVERKYAQNDANARTVVVPDLTDMTKEQATTALTQKGLTAYYYGSEGTVVEQLPVAGERVKAGEVVAITLKTAEQIGPVPMIAVPDLMGKTPEECQTILTGLGLNYYGHGTGKAVWQNYKKDAQVKKKTEIRVEFAP